MYHIHIFTGTHAEVAAASQETLGYPLIDPTQGDPEYPQLTHSVLAVAKVGDKVAYDLAIVEPRELEESLEVYLTEATKKLAALLFCFTSILLSDHQE